METDIKDSIKKLAGAAGAQAKSEDAQKFAQAALNLAHVLATLDNLKDK